MHHTNKKTVAIFLLLAVLAGAALCCIFKPACPFARGTQPVQHIVLVWLKADTAPEVREQIIAGSKALDDIGQIRDLQVGKAIASERPIVDDSFSFGIYMRFDSAADMNTYLTDPRHVQFVDTQVKPYLEKLVVYDF
jgi:hypothetical protein